MVQGKINSGRHTDHPAGCHSIRTNQSPPPPSHFLQAGYPSCRPINSVKALKATSALGLGRRRLNGVTCTVSVPQKKKAKMRQKSAKSKPRISVDDLLLVRSYWIYSTVVQDHLTLPYLTFGVNSLLNRLLSAEAIFEYRTTELQKKYQKFKMQNKNMKWKPEIKYFSVLISGFFWVIVCKYIICYEHYQVYTVSQKNKALHYCP